MLAAGRSAFTDSLCADGSLSSRVGLVISLGDVPSCKLQLRSPPQALAPRHRAAHEHPRYGRLPSTERYRNHSVSLPSIATMADVDPRMMKVSPRIRYNTIGGVNGPLVILENVRNFRSRRREC